MGEPILTGFDLQLLLTVGLFLLSWALHRWLERREYFLWWTFAWGALVIGMLAQRLPSLVGMEEWAGAAQLIAAPFAVLQAAFFWFGARNLRTEEPVDRGSVTVWVTVSVVVGLTAGALSMASADDPELLRAYRGVARQVALAFVLPYCALAFSGARHGEKWGTALTMLGFLGYGVNQALYALGSIELLAEAHFTLAFPAPTGWILTATAFFLDIAFESAIGAGAVLLLIADHREARATLAASEDRFRAAFEGAPIGVAVLDEGGRVNQANPLLREMLALDGSEEEIFLPGLAVGQDAERLRQDLDDLVVGRTTLVDGEYRFRRLSGEEVWARVRAGRVRTASGTLQVVFQAQDVTGRRALERSRRELTALVERSSDLIILNDRNGIRYLNPAGHGMLGLEPAQAEGMNAMDLVDTDDPDALEAEVERALAAEGSWSGELWLRDASGDSSRPVSATLFQIREKASGATVGTGAICRDITERKRAEVDLLRAKEEAEAANRAKGEFLATMSHEIRTPMNAIIGMAELLNETQLTPEQRDYIQVFSTAGDTLLNLINEILDLSKMEAGRLTLDVEPFRLRELVERTVELYAVPAHREGLEIAGHVAPDIPEWLSGDVARLRQVLANLVGNAVKFTEEGEVIVDVEALRADDESVDLRVSVRDTGVGIPAEQVDRIFERFTQADSSTTRRFGGTGLGLTISRGIVELMGGRIWAE